MKEEVEFGFPGTPYGVQMKLMHHAYSAMSAGGLCVLESPTGTGKSLSFLCAATAWLRDWQKVIVVSNLQAYHPQDEEENIPPWVSNQLASSHDTEADAIISQWAEFRKRVKSVLHNIGVLGSSGTAFEINAKRKRDAISGTVESDEDLLTDQDNQSDQPFPREEKGMKRPQMFICSRTHSQLSQLLHEVRKIPQADLFNIVTLGSRAQLCINPDVRKGGPAATVNDACRKLVENSACEYKKHSSALADLVSAVPLDIEEVCSKSSSLTQPGCPYFATRSALETADLIFVPYASILHSKTRESLGIDISGSVVIIDEAHNLLDAINSARSCSISEKELRGLEETLRGYLEIYTARLSGRNNVLVKQTKFLVKRMLEHLTRSQRGSLSSISDFVTDSRLSDINLNVLMSLLSDGQFARKLRGFAERKSIEFPGASYSLSSFLEAILGAVDSDRIFVRGHAESLSLVFAGIDAEAELVKLVTSARSVCLTGGTMQPIDDLKAVAQLAGVKFSAFSGSPVIDEGRIMCRFMETSVHGRPLRFDSSTRADPEMITTVCETVGVVCDKLRSGGIILFVASYEFAKLISTSVTGTCKARGAFLFLDTGSIESEQLMRRYKAAVDARKCAVLVSVVNGRLSEGIDFRDDLCRCVIVVGLPYPNLADPVLKERMAFFDRRRNLVPLFPSGQSYYESRCLKAINQSIGRAVRHINDWSAIILMDCRYSEGRIRSGLSAWVSHGLCSSRLPHLGDELYEFFGKYHESN